MDIYTLRRTGNYAITLKILYEDGWNTELVMVNEERALKIYNFYKNVLCENVKVFRGDEDLSFKFDEALSTNVC